MKPEQSRAYAIIADYNGMAYIVGWFKSLEAARDAATSRLGSLPHSRFVCIAHFTVQRRPSNETRK